MLIVGMVIVFLFFTLLGMPLYFSFGLAAAFACLFGDLPLQVIAQRLFIGMDSFVLLAIPGFVLVGNIMTRGGISQRIVDFCNSLVGYFKGGLLMVTVLTSMIMGGISGSAVADTAAVGTVLIPSLEKNNYPKGFSSAVVGTAGPLGNIIPPSIPMIVYSMVAGLAVFRLFLAGYIPGMMIGFSLMGLCYFISKRRKYGPPSTSQFSLKRVVITFKKSLLALITPVIIVGGIVFGVFTATEAAMVGVIYSLIVAVGIYRELSWDQLPGVLLESVKTSAKLVIIIASASVFSYISINEGVPEMLRDFMFSISTNKYVILLILNLILLATGLIIDILVATVIIVPILIPLGNALGIHPLHMAMIFVLNMSIGLLTPPVGYCLFVSSEVAKIPMEETAVNAIPVILTMLGILLLINLFPQISLFIPSLFR